MKIEEKTMLRLRLMGVYVCVCEREREREREREGKRERERDIERERERDIPTHICIHPYLYHSLLGLFREVSQRVAHSVRRRFGLRKREGGVEGSGGPALVRRRLERLHLGQGEDGVRQDETPDGSWGGRIGPWQYNLNVEVPIVGPWQYP